MKKIFLNIEVHQPMRLQTYRFFEIMKNHYYYNDYENEFYIKKVSEKFYLPANRIMLDLIHYSKKNFKVSILFSGVALDQFELYAPEMIESYQTMTDTGCVEFLSGTFSNSFGPFSNTREYNNQVKLQRSRIKFLFGKNPLPFPVRDIYNYNSWLTYPGIRILIGNGISKYNILNGVTGKNLNDWLLKPEKLIKLLNTYGKEGYEEVSVFIPYDLFGDFQNYTGILEFLEDFTIKVLSKSDFTFDVPSGKVADFKSGLQTESLPEYSGVNFQRFYSICNEMQIDAFEKLYSLSKKIEKCNDPLINKDWLYLQTCDHFYFMNPELYRKSKFHGIVLPNDSHFFAYINYMNILTDFSDRLEKWINEYKKEPKGFYGNPAKVDKDKLDYVTSVRAEKFSDNHVNISNYQIKKSFFS